MPVQTDFATRIARIEARAASGQKAEFAPLPDEHAAPRDERPSRSLFSGLFARLVFPVVAGTAIVAAFAAGPERLLPESLRENLMQSDSPIALMLFPRDEVEPTLTGTN